MVRVRVMVMVATPVVTATMGMVPRWLRVIGGILLLHLWRRRVVRSRNGGSVWTGAFKVGARAGDLAPQAIETAFFAQAEHLPNRCHSKHCIGVRPGKPPQRAHRRSQSLVRTLRELSNLVEEFSLYFGLRFGFTGGLSEGQRCLIVDAGIQRIRSNRTYRLDHNRSNHQG